jgi:Fe-S cluster assembly iron-binding protein IscA
VTTSANNIHFIVSGMNSSFHFDNPFRKHQCNTRYFSNTFSCEKT